MCKVLLLCPLEEEFNEVVRQMDIGNIVGDRSDLGRSLVIGFLGGVDVIVAVTGVGKVNMAIAAMRLMERFKPQLTILCGTAGIVCPHVELFDVVMGTGIFCHDMLAPGLGYERGEIPFDNHGVDYSTATMRVQSELIEDDLEELMVLGNIMTGDTFLTSLVGLEEFIVKHDIVAADMESVALAQVCELYNHPFIVLRGLTDRVGKCSPGTFNEHLEKASRKVAMMAREVVRTMRDKEWSQFSPFVECRVN